MTGLDPAQHVIVEIATLVTDDDLEIVAEGPDLVVHQPADALARMEDVVRDMHTRERAARRRSRRRRSRSPTPARRRSRSCASTSPSRAPCRCAATRSAPTAASSPCTSPRSRSSCTTGRSTSRRSRSWRGAGTPQVLDGAPKKAGTPPRARRHPRERRGAALLPRAGLQCTAGLADAVLTGRSSSGLPAHGDRTKAPSTPRRGARSRSRRRPTSTEVAPGHPAHAAADRACRASATSTATCSRTTGASRSSTRAAGPDVVAARWSIG